MRILILTPTFLPALGGAELVILQVYRRLATRHSVLVLTPYLSEDLLKTRSSKEYDHLINFGVERYHDRVTLMKIPGHRASLGLIPPFSLSAASAIRHVTNGFKPDVINVHYVMPTGFAGLYAQKVLKIPTVVTYNGRDVPGPGVPPLWKYWHKIVGRNCADMTFVSKYCRDVIYGPESNRGHVVYNGVERASQVQPEQVVGLRKRLQIGQAEHVLFALQRLDYLKRIDIIIHGMKEILESRSYTRLVIGGKGPDFLRLKNSVNELGISKEVIFVGFIPDQEMPVYFAMADLFVFHSTYETFGMVLAEAMNYGKAVVSVANTAIQEVVDHGETGLLVPTHDHLAFAQAVLDLLNNTNRREQMGKRARKKAQNTFQWDTIAAQYERVLEAAAFKEDAYT